MPGARSLTMTDLFGNEKYIGNLTRKQGEALASGKKKFQTFMRRSPKDKLRLKHGGKNIVHTLRNRAVGKKRA